MSYKKVFFTLLPLMEQLRLDEQEAKAWEKQALEKHTEVAQDNNTLRTQIKDLNRRVQVADAATEEMREHIKSQNKLIGSQREVIKSLRKNLKDADEMLAADQEYRLKL